MPHHIESRKITPNHNFCADFVLTWKIPRRNCPLPAVSVSTPNPWNLRVKPILKKYPNQIFNLAFARQAHLRLF
ncbi:MAG: hypothetical protein CL678_17050 [Bdellovibrionaceae bacterium]|nr:hypothetical protein [Pseudobdellovibrionaceae bacterium]